MLRLLMRLLVTLLLAAMRGRLGDGPRLSDKDPEPRVPKRRRPPRLDRADVVDVPFTELPPESQSTDARRTSRRS